jgi:3-phenylpropionate/trans-cinnamate dioxygenase ferredoxin subunit
MDAGRGGRVSDRVRVCGLDELPPGARRVVEVGGRRIGLVNVRGEIVAFHDRCPHRGGSLCRGPLTGTTTASGPGEYRYEREGEILRCSHHGWEFDLVTGRCLADERMRMRTYPAGVEDGAVYVVPRAG